MDPFPCLLFLRACYAYSGSCSSGSWRIGTVKLLHVQSEVLSFSIWQGAMAMAALRRALRALPSPRGFGVLRGEAGRGGQLHLQRAAYTDSEAKSLARVRRLAKELSESVEAFPGQAAEASDLPLEFVKMRQHQKYYKNGMWVLIGLHASISLTGSYAIIQLDRDVSDLKEKVDVAKKEIIELKKQGRMARSSPAKASGDAASPPPSVTAA